MTGKSSISVEMIRAGWKSRVPAILVLALPSVFVLYLLLEIFVPRTRIDADSSATANSLPTLPQNHREAERREISIDAERLAALIRTDPATLSGGPVFEAEGPLPESPNEEATEALQAAKRSEGMYYDSDVSDNFLSVLVYETLRGNMEKKFRAGDVSDISLDQGINAFASNRAIVYDSKQSDGFGLLSERNLLLIKSSFWLPRGFDNLQRQRGFWGNYYHADVVGDEAKHDFGQLEQMVDLVEAEIAGRTETLDTFEHLRDVVIESLKGRGIGQYAQKMPLYRQHTFVDHIARQVAMKMDLRVDLPAPMPLTSEGDVFYSSEENAARHWPDRLRAQKYARELEYLGLILKANANALAIHSSHGCQLLKNLPEQMTAVTIARWCTETGQESHTRLQRDFADTFKMIYEYHVAKSIAVIDFSKDATIKFGLDYFSPSFFRQLLEVSDAGGFQLYVDAIQAYRMNDEIPRRAFNGELDAYRKLSILAIASPESFSGTFLLNDSEIHRAKNRFNGNRGMRDKFHQLLKVAQDYIESVGPQLPIGTLRDPENIVMPTEPTPIFVAESTSN